MINPRYWHPMKKPLQVHLYMHFPVSVCIQFWDTHWNIPVGKAVPCNFLCLSFLLELFLYTLCDYVGKTVDILATGWLNTCIWFHMFQPFISFSHIKELTSLLDTFCWYWWSSPLCWQNTLLLTWEILLWGYKEHNCWFLMLVYSFK